MAILDGIPGRQALYGVTVNVPLVGVLFAFKKMDAPLPVSVIPLPEKFHT